MVKLTQQARCLSYSNSSFQLVKKLLIFRLKIVLHRHIVGDNDYISELEFRNTGFDIKTLSKMNSDFIFLCRQMQ